MLCPGKSASADLFLCFSHVIDKPLQPAFEENGILEKFAKGNVRAVTFLDQCQHVTGQRIEERLYTGAPSQILLGTFPRGLDIHRRVRHSTSLAAATTSRLDAEGAKPNLRLTAAICARTVL